MNQDRQTPQCDFIEQYDARLNLIYRRWEEQIALEARKKSKIASKPFAPKNLWWAGVAVTLGSAIALCHYGSTKIATRQLNANYERLALASQRLGYMTDYRYKSYCVNDDSIYELASGNISSFNSPQPQAFSSHLNTLSLTRHSKTTYRPDAYLHLNPHVNLLYGTIEETDGVLTTESYVLGLDPDRNPMRHKERKIEAEVQANAIELEQEFFSCLGNREHFGFGGMYPD